MALSETTTRALVAIVGIPVAGAAIYAGSWALAALVAILGAIGVREFYRLAERKDVRPLRAAGTAIVLLFVAMAAGDPAAGLDGAGLGSAIIVTGLIVGGAVIWLRGVEGEPLLAWSITLTGAVYVGGTLCFALFLRHLPGHEGVLHGTALVFAPIVLTWASDTCAYFAGRAFGTRKLIPAVSPGKTVQGAIGALLGTILVAMTYPFLLAGFDAYRLSLPEAAAFGLLVSIAAQLGDLAESLLKRDAGVKDSGRIFPGHGGVLDRLDSLFFTLPLGYFFFRFVIGAPEPF